MKRYFTSCILLLLIYIPGIFAQDKTANIEQIIAEIFEQYSAETEETLDYDSFYEDLIDLANSPINLNTATKEQFNKLPFLSDIQIENILFYIYQYGKLNTIFELQLIDGIDMTDIRNMLPFVVLGDNVAENQKIYFKELLKYGKNNVFFRLDHTLEQKKGYATSVNTANNEIVAPKYLGKAFYNSLKYQYAFKDRVKFGFTMEKDAGEQFFSKQNFGYDYHSFYGQINNIGKFKTIVLGDFRASFGQGLVLGSGFGMGKSSYVMNVNPLNNGLKKYSSTDENNFFRGVGATLKHHNFNFTAFYSDKYIDGDTSKSYLSSIYKTGLHRTISELAKKHTVNQKAIAINTSYTFSKIQLGFTLVHTKLNYNIMPENQGYNILLNRGNTQTTCGLNYRFRLYKLNFFGESAMTNAWAKATLNGVSFTPFSQVSIVALMRYYAPDFDNFYAKSFTEGSKSNNETGWYIATDIRPFKNWKLVAYADSYKFPWLKYGVDAPSMGKDYLIQVDHNPNRYISMYWRYKTELKQTNNSNTSSVITSICPIKKDILKFQLQYKFGNFSFKNLIEGNRVQLNYLGSNYGLTALQDISYSYSNIPLKIDVRYQFFDAENYDNRFYTYEKDILYAFSIPMYYGKGSRYYLNFKYELNKNTSLWFKIAQTVYADNRESISSGDEEIQGNRKTDLRFMMRYEF